MKSRIQLRKRYQIVYRIHFSTLQVKRFSVLKQYSHPYGTFKEFLLAVIMNPVHTGPCRDSSLK